MSKAITAADLDHFERSLEALLLEVKISDKQMFELIAIHQACVTAAIDKENGACAQIAKHHGKLVVARAIEARSEANN